LSGYFPILRSRFKTATPFFRGIALMPAFMRRQRARLGGHCQTGGNRSRVPPDCFGVFAAPKRPEIATAESRHFRWPDRRVERPFMHAVPA